MEPNKGNTKPNAPVVVFFDVLFALFVFFALLTRLQTLFLPSFSQQTTSVAKVLVRRTRRPRSINSRHFKLCLVTD